MIGIKLNTIITVDNCPSNTSKDNMVPWVLAKTLRIYSTFFSNGDWRITSNGLSVVSVPRRSFLRPDPCKNQMFYYIWSGTHSHIFCLNFHHNILPPYLLIQNIQKNIPMVTDNHFIGSLKTRFFTIKSNLKCKYLVMKKID